MKKRGQVTVFIILGLIVIILVGVYFGLKQTVLKDVFQEEIQKHKNVPLQIQPVNEYLDSCAAQVAEEGIALIALQGGYTELPKDTMPTSSFNPLSSSLEIFPNTDLKTAVWFREQPNGVQTARVPSIINIESELARYINQNYARCINNLTSFTEQGFSFVVSGTPKSRVDIRENVVDVSVELPVQATKEGITFSLESHLAQLNSKLGQLYGIAVEILNSENKDSFLENKTIDILVAYDPEVPFTGTNMNCNGRVWSKRAVSEKLKDVLFENVAAFRIKGTNYEITDKKFNYLAFDALDSSHKDVTVNMMYSPRWPTAVEINPSDGDLMKEDSISNNLGSEMSGVLSSYFCMNVHHFVYTIKYPILFTITGDDGLIFQFAYQVIIDRNLPKKNSVLIDNIPDTSAQFCRYPQTRLVVETYAISSTGDVVPVDDAEIYFKCYPATCRLESQKISDNSYLVTAPVCYQGSLEARKEGYYNGKTIEVSTNHQIDKPIPIILIPKYKKAVKIFVIDKATGEIRKPYDSEQVTFSFNNEARQTPYSASIIYPSEDNTIELIPGKYKINSYVTGNSTWPITMPKQKVQHCTRVGAFLGIFGGQEKCVESEIPEVKMDIAIKGGVNFEYEFKPEELGKDSELVLYTMASPIPSNLDAMAKIYEEIDANSDDPRFRYPEI